MTAEEWNARIPVDSTVSVRGRGGVTKWTATTGPAFTKDGVTCVRTSGPDKYFAIERLEAWV